MQAWRYKSTQLQRAALPPPKFRGVRGCLANIATITRGAPLSRKRPHRLLSVCTPFLTLRLLLRRCYFTPSLPLSHGMPREGQGCNRYAYIMLGYTLEAYNLYNWCVCAPTTMLLPCIEALSLLGAELLSTRSYQLDTE